MLDVLNGFVNELRAAGIPVSLTETIDAMTAVKAIPLEDRGAFKAALGCTMVKNQAHYRAFETVFEVYFSMRGMSQRELELLNDMDPEAQAGEELRQMMQADAQGGMEGLSPEELAQMLYQALLNADQQMMRALAKASVTRFSGMEPGRPVGGTYYLYRTLRQLDLDGMLEKLMEDSRG
jgi:uncharacterized protein